MIGSKIVEARAQKGFSQGKLAERSGVYKSTIQRYERGANPIRRNVEKIAKALEIPVEYFYEADDAPGKASRRSNLPEKIKRVIEFSVSEQRAVEEVINQILEKRKVIGDLHQMVSKLNP